MLAEWQVVRATASQPMCRVQAPRAEDALYAATSSDFERDAPPERPGAEKAPSPPFSRANERPHAVDQVPQLLSGPAGERQETTLLPEAALLLSQLGAAPPLATHGAAWLPASKSGRIARISSSPDHR